ncbi:hypothetical protein [Arthrobacter zhaoguopingii]|uniref:hypothetical protein n=1 Tax=Arthrobacter zhaoguopingii TaxID=2681491 RepID=UPI00135A80CE|nr:hypothetical protein [Arthrobacter zhaoguopingii]
MTPLTPEQRGARRAELLWELGEIHAAWIERHKDNVDFQPERDSNPHDGQTSDYNLHALDRSATAEQEADFARATRHILDELKALRES